MVPPANQNGADPTTNRATSVDGLNPIETKLSK